MTRSSGELVRSYFSACNDAPAELIAAHFTADAVVYDLNHPPVTGAKQIGLFWADVRTRWSGARWTIVRLVETPSAVAVEWRMDGRRHGETFTAHGSDHFDLREGRISEVRQYWVLDRERRSTSLRDHPQQRSPAD